jgi:hypothetical protein
VESFTYNQYQVDLEIGFHVYVGVVSVISPEGEIRVAAIGGVGTGVVNGSGSLQGPRPALL